ncbi:MAG: flocculation-associated PEP-CTERM protein PepA [Massilia sp.]|nr:flocculation-associated PEP-CTERM protein PepA [Massilia sp.]
MKIFAKTLLACSAVTCLLVTSVASAITYNPFTFKPLKSDAFIADKITGNYVEVATFDAVKKTFDVSLFWNAGQFVTDNGQTALDASDTGLGYDFRMYGLYHAAGTFAISGPKTTLSFKPGSGRLQIYVDNGVGTGANGHKTDLVHYTKPTSGTGDFVFARSSDDILIEDGFPLSGVGTLDTSLSTCGVGKGINCGSFGSTTEFALTVAGKSYFSGPKTFYDTSFQSGQLNNFETTGTQTINGALDLTFANVALVPASSVPEPATTVLFGLGLLGVSLTRLRKKS